MWSGFAEKLRFFIKDDEGLAMIEYALLLALIGAALAAAALALGNAASGQYSVATTAVQAGGS